MPCFWRVIVIVGLVAHGAVRAENFSGSFDVSRVGRVIQFLPDPSDPNTGWMLTERVVQVNRGLRRGGDWRVVFSPITFARVTGSEPVNYRPRKIQVARTSGVLYLLVESGEPGSSRKYVFRTSDYGEQWEYSVLGSRKAPQGRPPQVARRPPSAKSPEPPGEEEAVDLGELEAEPERGADRRPGSSHGGGSQPLFQIYFDLLFYMRSGAQPWTFDNFHSLTLVEVFPRENLRFSFELSPTPRYYELLYRAGERLRFRAGRIWIPFGTIDAHNMYGGYVNTSMLAQPGASAFLPDVWTDLGLAVNYRLVDSPSLQLEADLYVVNGFQDGGVDDPVGEVGKRYPDFSVTPNPDNNTDKAVGLRVKSMFENTIGITLSGYTQRYTADDDENARMYFAGVDAELVPLVGTRLRVGYAYMLVDLVSEATKDQFFRGGLYAEAHQRLTDSVQVVVRGGASQNDNRISEISDQTTAGGSLIYQTGLFRFSLNYFRDLLEVPGKTARDYLSLRAMARF